MTRRLQRPSDVAVNESVASPGPQQLSVRHQQAAAHGQQQHRQHSGLPDIPLQPPKRPLQADRWLCRSQALMTVQDQWTSGSAHAALPTMLPVPAQSLTRGPNLNSSAMSEVNRLACRSPVYWQLAAVGLQQQQRRSEAKVICLRRQPCRCGFGSQLQTAVAVSEHCRSAGRSAPASYKCSFGVQRRALNSRRTAAAI